MLSLSFSLSLAHSLSRSLSLSQCSVTCGQGKTTRQVLCVNFSDQEVNASECDPDDRPATEQDCAMSQCPSRSSEPRPFPSSPNTSARNNLPHNQSHQWRTGPWGAVRHPAPSRSHFSCRSLCFRNVAGGFGLILLVLPGSWTSSVKQGCL